MAALLPTLLLRLRGSGVEKEIKKEMEKEVEKEVEKGIRMEEQETEVYRTDGQAGDS